MSTHFHRLRTSWWVRMAALLLSMMLLTSCVGLPTTVLRTTQGHKTCDALLFDEVRARMNSAWDTREDLVAWIRDTFGVVESDLRFAPESAQTRWGTADSYSWPEAGTYWHVLVRGTRLVSFNAGWATNEPSVRNVLQCLGKPSSYIADYKPGFEFHGPIVLVDVFYPEVGTTFSFSTHVWEETNSGLNGERHLLPIDADATAIERISMSEPVFDDEALVDQLMGDSYGLGPSWVSDSTREWLLDMLRPWPDDVRELEYEMVSAP